MVEFSDVFIDATKFARKIKKGDYLKSGIYPIIDQGQEFVIGYTNDEKGLYNDVPAIIFGDHTRIIKYIDKPFFIGADGVKVLKTKIDDVDYKYLYYALRNIDIINTGYNRHFKWLKESKIKLSDLNKQQKIATILDSIENIVNLKNMQLQEYDQLIKSRFVEMFGDIQNNSKQYRTHFLKDICSIKTGGTPSRNHPEYFEGTIPWITTVALGKLEIDKLDAIELITENAVNNSSTKIIPAGSILFGTRVGVGKTSINKVDLCTNQDIAAITEISKDYNLIFLKNVLDSYSEYFNNQKRGATIQGITTDTLKNIHIPIIDLEVQKEFAAFFEQVDKLKFEVQKSLSETQMLFDALMQEYFG